ncbi:MAG TPA: G1 family glutamic endopeptidase [Acidimicrobiales bacterium]|nr:G1 family glutamic endopeptidase [Acidimicrobiales bacterium]
MAPLFGVVFNASGGSGTMKDEINREGTSAPLTANVFTRTGYTFSGWNSAADGSGAGYTNGATYLVVANATLYAQWTIAASQFQTSSNWAGYILNGGVGGYQAVSGQWTVPTLNCQATPDGNVSVWVGVNGVNTSHGLFQDGTSSSCANGVETSYAWWTDEAMGYLTQTVFQVQTGDVITADVTQTPSGTWQYDVSDITTGAVSSQVEGYSGVGTSAEWIVEDPGMASGGLYPLGNFGSETITDLGLTVPSGSWTLPTPSDAMELTPIPFT